MPDATGEVIIDDSNFGEYFFDLKKNAPKRGQVLARFSAIAGLVNGFPKDQIVSILLTNEKGGDLAPQLLRNVCNATEGDSIRLAKDIALDLVSGMSEEEVLDKTYKFNIEIFYWTQEEYVPKDSPYWTTIKMLNNLENQGEEDATVTISM